MHYLLVAVLIGSAPHPDQPTASELLEIMESLQSKIIDFECEYEGTQRALVPEMQKAFEANPDGVHGVYSGHFIYARPGRFHVDSLQREVKSGKVINVITAVDETKDEAEYYRRNYDKDWGEAFKVPLIRKYVDDSGSLGIILSPIWRIRQYLTRKHLNPSVEDTLVEGRPMKLLTFTDTNVNCVVLRYWIDLNRDGHVVRNDGYTSIDGSLVGKTLISLKQFNIDGEPVWFPVSGISEGFIFTRDNKLVYSKEPTQREEIYILLDTLKFNRNPPASAFKIDYKPGTPISDQLKKLRYEFGQQQPPPRLTRETAEKHLQEQLALANAQRKELVAPPPTQDGFDLSRAAPWIFGTAALICSTLLILQRRRS
jgi:hypothetical protein